MQTIPASGARKNSQFRSTAIRLAAVSWRAMPIDPYTTAPRSRRMCAKPGGNAGTT